MYKPLLQSIGLTPDEATVYETLLIHGSQGAGGLVKRIKDIKRSLLYKVLERLVDKGLILQTRKQGKLEFSPQPPGTLVRLAEKQEEVARRSHEAIASSLPELKAKYNLSTEKPVIRFFEGVEGLKKMYEERLAAGNQETYLIRSSRARVYYEAFGKWFTYYLARRAKLGVKVHALTVDDEHAIHDPKIDKARHTIRTWLRPQDYTAPIDISVQGDHVSLLSYGKEMFGIVMENAPMAQAFKEVFLLAEKGAKTIPILHDHPKAPTEHDFLKKK